MARIDLNADVGESFGAWAMGADAELLGLVTSANVACGFHAGDPAVMAGGSAEERKDTQNKLSARAAMPAAAAAEAAGFYGAAPKVAEHDLVDLAPPEQKKALAAAPPALAGKTEAEALAYLQQQKTRRDALQGRIRELTRQREQFLAATPSDGFDDKVVGALKEQATKQGIAY